MEMFICADYANKIGVSILLLFLGQTGQKLIISQPHKANFLQTLKNTDAHPAKF
jgi:hypothetical protein